MTKVKSAVKKPKENRLRKAFQWLFSAPFKWYDWVLLGMLLAVLFLCFQMHDLFHKSGCSFGFLNGHFLDFYDYLEAAGIDEAGGQGLWASYLPTIYFIFAVWNAPLRLFGIVTTPTAQLPFAAIMWAKILPCLLYLGCGVLIYLIAKELGMGERKSKTVMYAAITVPAAL